MRKIIYITLLLAATGCSKKLDLLPISNKNVDGFYKTTAQFNQAIMGCYDGLQNSALKQNFSYMMTESRSDNAWQRIDYDDGQISRFSDNAALPVLNSAWVLLYNYISRCNYVLDALKTNTTLDGTFKATTKGEALFLRALFYFDLVRFFGGVPIVDKAITIKEGYALKKASIEEVYDFIVSDLKEAATLLPDQQPSDNKDRATAIAARGFLGKVYVFRSGYPLKKNEWSLAATELKAVLDKVGDGGFLTNYSDIFDYSKENGKQAIFSIGCKSGADGEGNPYPSRNAPNSMVPGTDPLMIPFGGSPMQLFLDDFILNSLFDEPNDNRYTYSIQNQWLDKSGSVISDQPFVKKYRSGPVAANSDWDIDWILLQYTDVYMLYGEAMYHQSQPGIALDVLNRVRGRAGLTALASTDIDTEDKFVDRLLKERRKEFCFENQRWFDLVRTDKALDIMKPFLDHYGAGSNFSSRDQYYYKIPQQETSITGIQ